MSDSLAETDLELLIPFAFISQVLGFEMNAITPNFGGWGCVRRTVHVRAGVRDQIQDLS